MYCDTQCLPYLEEIVKLKRSSVKKLETKQMDMKTAIEAINGLGEWNKNRVCLVYQPGEFWFVQVHLGFNPLLYTDLIESREFDSYEEANRCFQTLIPLRHVYPLDLVYVMNSF